MFDFDTPIPRRNTNSIKWADPAFAAKRGVPADALPLWVADMDFAAPPCVSAELARRAQHGIFGYADTDTPYFDTLRSWFARRHGWDIDPAWLVKTPGVVPALYLAVAAYTQPGDAVLIQPPVYYPFREAIRDTGRRVADNPLVFDGQRYTIDFDDFAQKAADPAVKLFILCSPHNPVGRVWTADELNRMAEICRESDVIIISDEIHADFIYPDKTPWGHTVLASLSSDAAQNCLIATAPSKTFNLAGLQLANIFIPNEDLRRRYLSAFRAAGFSQPGLMGIAACQAAYTQQPGGGEDWLAELLTYLQANFAYLDERLRAQAPAIKLIQPEGTYLAWLDCRDLGMKPTELDHFMSHKAKLWLDGGTMFGPEGAGFQRLNTACPRATLTQALDQLTTAL